MKCARKKTTDVSLPFRPGSHRSAPPRKNAAMSARPSRRRGRLTEGQEAAAKELRELREGGGKRVAQSDALIMCFTVNIHYTS